MSIEYRIGDVFERLAEIPDGSVDLIVTSPPFLALRSYLPADHPDKHKEIGSETTPAEFIDTLLALTAEWGRVLAPHGSICVELGDTFAGSGGAGGDYSNADGLRSGQATFRQQRSNGWPLAKSLTGIPTLYTWSLAYGRNLLTGVESPAGQWRIRNVIVWARPNPPVGALGDKFRPATSYITVACKGPKRYFDLDAVRTASDLAVTAGGNMDPRNKRDDDWRTGHKPESGGVVNPAGAPPLDWHADDHPEDGDWLWKLSTQPYKGSHYATYPLRLPTRLIEAMCPQRVCVTCGQASERIVADRSGFDRQPLLAAHIKERREAAGVTSAEINDRLGYKEIAKNWERTDKHGAAIPNARDWAIVKPWLGLSDEFDDLVYGERRWTESTIEYHVDGKPLAADERRTKFDRGGIPTEGVGTQAQRVAPNDWTDCGHDNYRTGVVLDPFAGSGTTLEAAQNVGRHAIGIDLDARNADLAQQRVGMFLEIKEAA